MLKKQERDDSLKWQLSCESTPAATNNDQTVNTLKEIADLKKEMLKLTTSLRVIQISPTRHSQDTSKIEHSPDEPKPQKHL